MTLSYVHRYSPPSASDRRTLLVLHGTGGDENDLLPLAAMLAPTAGVLSPRGDVLENGAPRFFRRLAEGVFDLDDLRLRTDQLATFLAEAATTYGFDAGQVVAVGFSNGANIAASLLLAGTGALRAAILFRPMIPFEPHGQVDLTGASAYVAGGRSDPIVPPGQTQRLAELLAKYGADVSVAWSDGGHGLTRADVAGAVRWLNETLPAP